MDLDGLDKLASGCKEIGEVLIAVAIEERQRFIAEHGRMPDDGEAREIASMIERQFKTALTMTKR